jgi:uncharacterized protein YndB with AHSA1/START domain
MIMTTPTTLPPLPHSLERTVLIQAPPETVFRFFQDSARWAKWWGAGSTVDPRVGGDIHIRHPGGIESGGRILEITPPARLVFTYGFMSGDPIPVGGSRVTIELKPERGATRLTLTHDLASEKVRDEHVQGWRFQLSLFANAVADEANASAARYVDLWFQAWGDPSAAARATALREVATPALRFQDRFSNLDGADDVLAHLTAVQRFMPGMTLKRAGDVRHCQGMVLADWVATGIDGKERGKGTNVFVLAPDGRIEWVTGFWG